MVLPSALLPFPSQSQSQSPAPIRLNSPVSSPQASSRGFGTLSSPNGHFPHSNRANSPPANSHKPIPMSGQESGRTAAQPISGKSDAKAKNAATSAITAQTCIDEHKKYFAKQVEQSKEELEMLMGFEKVMSSPTEKDKRQASSIYKQEMMNILELRLKDLTEFKSKLQRLQ